MKFLRWLLVFVPISVFLALTLKSPLLIFSFSCLSMVPLAALLSELTEKIVSNTSPKIGGLLSATMSNIPELLIGISAVRAGMYDLVMYSMAGAMIGNILLVLGASTFLGGLGKKYQYFDKNNARSNFLLLLSCAFGIVIPFSLSQSSRVSVVSMQNITLCISLVMLITYVSGLIFSLVTHKASYANEKEQLQKTNKETPIYIYVFLLVGIAFAVAIESNILVGQIESLISGYGFSELFIGIIIIPLLGNVAENVSAVVMAIKDKVDACIEIAIGSSIQISLFVAPVLVLITFLIGNPIIYVFGSFEMVAVLASIGVSLFVFQDGRTNWLEGIVLIGGYIMLAVAFFFL